MGITTTARELNKREKSNNTWNRLLLATSIFKLAAD